MSDYDGFEGAESDLEVHGDYQESSGWSALETTQEGMQVEKHIANGGNDYIIDTHGDAQKAQDHKEKEEKKHDRLEAMWNGITHAHSIGEHKYSFESNGHEINMDHDSLKKFMKQQGEWLQKKALQEKMNGGTSAKTSSDLAMMQHMIRAMDQGTLSQQQIEDYNRFLDENPAHAHAAKVYSETVNKEEFIIDQVIESYEAETVELEEAKVITESTALTIEDIEASEEMPSMGNFSNAQEEVKLAAHSISAPSMGDFA